ncbi:MAG: HD domain-containing protein [bacterium]|nr:HD domain-containing protein [bacterium]
MDIQKIFKVINKVSKEEQTPIYVVGGFVRDFLMEVEQKQDLDFVVGGSGLVFAKKFDEAMEQSGSLVEFPDFDTARYVLESAVGVEIIVEFAGARAESYRATSRKPAVEAADIETDLSRRDFTVNAMAVPVAVFAGLRWPGIAKIKKEVVDPFHGQRDLAEKTLRTPLDPDQTFSDDPLRMMRAVRFATQLNFAIDPCTLQSIHKNRERLSIVSAERVREELFKLMTCAQPSIGLFLMFQTHLMDLVLPEICKLDGVEEIYGHQHKNNLVHTFKVVDNIATRTDKVLLRFAGLFHDIGKPQTKKFMPKIGWTFHQHEHVGKKMVYIICRRLKFSKNETDYLAKLVRWHQQPIGLMDNGITDSAVRRLIVSLGEELDDLLILGVSDITTGNPYKLKTRQANYIHLRARVAEVMEKDKMRSFQSPFRGEEIMAEAGLKPGPTVGKIKDAIEEAILDGVIPNDHDAAKDYFQKIKDQYLRTVTDWERV